MLHNAQYAIITCLSLLLLNHGVKYAHRFLKCRRRRLKRRRPDGSRSTACDYASLLCILYRDAGPKRCHHSQTSRAQSPLTPFTHVADWIVPFPRSQYYSPPSFKLSPYLRLFLPSLPPSRTRTRFMGNHHQMKSFLL